MARSASSERRKRTYASPGGRESRGMARTGSWEARDRPEKNSFTSRVVAPNGSPRMRTIRSSACADDGDGDRDRDVARRLRRGDRSRDPDRLRERRRGERERERPLHTAQREREGAGEWGL